MNLHRLFDVSVEGGVALISQGYWCRNLRLLGCSAETAAIPGEVVNSLSIHPEKGKDTLVALSGVYEEYEKGKQIVSVCFGVWVSARWNDDKLVVDLSNEGVPKHPARLYPDYIEAPIDGVVFSSAKQVKPCERSVGGDVLCQYLAGDIDVEAVRAAAEEASDARASLEVLAAEVRRHKSELESHRVMVAARDTRIVELEEELGGVENFANASLAHLSMWLDRIRKLVG